MKSGVKINSKSVTKCWNCKGGPKHAIRAQELASWLVKMSIPGISKVKELTGANFEKHVSGKQGIIFFQNYWQRNGQDGRTGDHIDLWNRNELGSIGLIGTWIRTSFSDFSERFLDMSDLKRSTQVLFWEIE